MYNDITSESMTVNFGGANQVEGWIDGLPKHSKTILGSVLLDHSRKIAQAMNENPPKRKGAGKYWVNRTFKLAESIRPSGAFVKDDGRTIIGNVTCDSDVYNDYGKTILHRARRRPQQIFYKAAAGKSPAQMAIDEFKPGLIVDAQLVLGNEIRRSMRGLTI